MLVRPAKNASGARTPSAFRLGLLTALVPGPVRGPRCLEAAPPGDAHGVHLVEGRAHPIPDVPHPSRVLHQLAAPGGDLLRELRRATTYYQGELNPSQREVRP
eukprot:4947812-Pyramimonas_sp.AAC.1